MRGFMSATVNVGASYGRMRRQVHSDVVDTESTPDILIIMPLDTFLSKHRGCKSHIPFSSLSKSCRKDFYEKVVYYYVNTWAQTLA